MAEKSDEDQFHFGHWLKSVIGATGKQVKAFAEEAQCNEATLHRWFRARSPRIEEAYRGRLANALSMPKSRIDHLLAISKFDVPTERALIAAEMSRVAMDVGVAMYERGRKETVEKILPIATGEYDRLLERLQQEQDAPEKRLQDRSKVLGRLEVPKDWDINILVPALKVLMPIPTWDLDIAAGGWVAVPINGELDLDDARQRAILEQGLFRVCISGDSMRPDWLPGDCVEFEMFRPDRDVLTIGEDYLCIRSDSVGTFKRLERFDDDALYFRALNRKKYPAPLRIARQDVARMARALHVVIDRRKGER